MVAATRSAQVRQRECVPQWRAFDDDAVRPRRPPAPAVSAVVVFWQQSPAPGPCLQRLRQAGHLLEDALELVVVDNGCPADLSDALAGLWDRWIEVSHNLGPAGARNLGARAASAPIVAFVDDDGHVAEDYFARALPYFDDADVLGIRGRVQPRNHPLFAALATHYDRGARPLEDALITEGASLVRRDAFLQCGGFPEGVDGHEGIELTHRLSVHHPRGTTLYAPDVVLRHDYVNGWGEFVAKSMRHARNETELQRRDEEAARFLDDYFQRSFPTRLTALQWLSRQGLRAVRFVLQTIARLRARTSSDEH